MPLANTTTRTTSDESSTDQLNELANIHPPSRDHRKAAQTIESGAFALSYRDVSQAAGDFEAFNIVGP